MNRGVWLFAFAGLILCAGMALFLSPHASSSPDGLERVAADQGFVERGEGAPLWRHALMPDYVFARFGNGPAATAAAGLFGTLLTFGVALGVSLGLTRLLRRRRQGRSAASPDTGSHTRESADT